MMTVSRLSGLPLPVRLAVAAALLVFALTVTADAVRPGRAEITGRGDFGQARLEGLEVSPEGRLLPGLAVQGRRLDAQYGWSILVDGAHVYVGAGDGARIHRFSNPVSDAGGEMKLDPEDTGTVAWSGRGLEVYTLAKDDAGRIIAGVSPVGHVHIFQPTPDGLVLVNSIAVPDSYVWRVLPVGEDLWIATGSGQAGRGGSVYRWRKDRLRRIWRGTDPHVLSLALSGGVIYAGTQGPEGVVLRFDDIENANVRTSVTWDPAQNEVIDFAVAADGAVFVCATTSPGRVPTRPGGGAGTASEESDEEGEGEGDEESERAPSTSPASPSATGTVIARIAPDGSVDEWVRARTAVRSLGFRNGRLYAGTAERGQVYRIDGPARTSLVIDVDEKTILDIEGDWLATSGPARLYRIADASETSTCTLEPFDASGPSDWGVVSWEAQGRWEVRTRSGNSATPNGTWSAWSAPLVVSGQHIPSPSARYLQVELRRVSRDTADWLRTPAITWQSANRGPRISSVTVTPLSTDQRVLSRLGRAGQVGQMILQLSQSARNLANSPAGRNAPTIEEILQPFLGFVQVGWSAEDPDGDRLVARVEVLDEVSGRAVLAGDDLRGDLFLLNTRNYADGRYRVRVTVTDTAENVAGGQASALTSEVFLVDNTAPTLSMRREGGVVIGTAADDLGRIESLHVLDAENRWRVLRPLDGISDQAKEDFRIETEGEVVVKATDQSGNVVYGRLAAR